MKRRISFFFLTLSVALMMGHNLIPHCHEGHLDHDHGSGLDTRAEFCLGHGLLVDVFSVVAHNHAGMVFFEHLQGDESFEKRTEIKPLHCFINHFSLNDSYPQLILCWSFAPPDIYTYDPANTRSLRAPPFFT